MTDSQFIGNTNLRLSMLEKQIDAIIQDMEQIKYAINNHSQYIQLIIQEITGVNPEDNSTDEEVREAAEAEADTLFDDMPEELRENAEEDFYDGKD